MFFVIVLFVLFVYISDAKPIDYEDVANLLPTEPQTTNDTLAAVVRDPVVQDAVQNTIGNRSLEGLVIKKKVLVMPATEPTKVYLLYSIYFYMYIYTINIYNYKYYSNISVHLLH